MNIPAELRYEVSAFTQFLDSGTLAGDSGYELLEARLDCLKFLTQRIDKSGGFGPEELVALREWFRAETDPWLMRSPLMRRARSWPEGYPGDYRTLELLYANAPGGDFLGQLVDRYLMSRTLAVAVRSRCRYLTVALNARAQEEAGRGAWLNLACGPCRELLGIAGTSGGRRVICVDSDKNALAHAAALLAGRPLGEFQFLAENAYRFTSAKRNADRFGPLTTIYSAGLFDYIADDRLAPILRGLYDSLAPGGVLFSPFKDEVRYETFDYHWLTKWHYFYQRDEAEFRGIFRAAGIPECAISMSRDASGVLLCFTLRRTGAEPGTAPDRAGHAGLQNCPLSQPEGVRPCR